MYKFLISLTLACGLAMAQTKSDPETATKKTVQQKGYHIVSPKNTGPTPPATKEEQDKDKADKDRRQRERDGLQDQKPPTLQPNVNPPTPPAQP